MSEKHKIEAGHAVGQPVTLRELESHVKGQTVYYEDVKVPRMLHLKVHRSSVAHARILDIDTSRAEQSDGVVSVLTYRDVPATKVWTPLKWHGAKQIKASQELRGEDKFDLFQVHNLVNWEGHLDTLQAMKSEGRLRYVGITTSHGSRHEEMAKIMATQAIDFVQFTYNVEDRDPEARLLGLAADKGIAVIINRPFQRGSLLDRFQGKPLPPWAADIACTSWAQFSLKFIVSHPAVTCAIPATSRVDHMHENMNVGRGPLPDMKTRARMAAYVKDL